MTPSPPLRLATLNLFSGRVLGAQGLRPSDETTLREGIESLRADVLAVQEVDVDQARSGGIDQFAVAAEALGADSGDAAFVATVEGTPGQGRWRRAPAVPMPARGPGRGPERGPLFGVGLICRRPVERWDVLELGQVRGRFPVPVSPRPPRVIWLPEEPRVVLAAVLSEPRMTVACTHLSFVPGANLLQLRRALHWLQTWFPPPHLLLGDLNLPPRLVRSPGWTPLVNAATYPAASPRMQLDHVLARGLHPAPTADGPGWTTSGGTATVVPFSDHRAVCVDLARH